MKHLHFLTKRLHFLTKSFCQSFPKHFYLWNICVSRQFFAFPTKLCILLQNICFLMKHLRFPEKLCVLLLSVCELSKNDCKILQKYCNLSKKHLFRHKISSHCPQKTLHSLAEETKVSRKVLQANAKFLRGTPTYLQEKAKVLQVNTKALKYNLSSHHHVPSGALYIFTILQTKWKLR